jgi:UDP:flavonoid glycosyltransferase YjiC (YdhE family)
VFFPEGAFGPTNNCVGIGDVLRRRGHRVVFIAEESFAGTLEAQGFEERLLRLGPAPAAPESPESPESPGQFWTDFVRDTAPVFRTTPAEQLEGFVAPTWQALADGARYGQERLAEIIEELSPDVVAEDNVCAFPALVTSGRPWVRIMSCNPLELRDPALPPPFSGLPATIAAVGRRSRPRTRGAWVRCSTRSRPGASSRARRRCPAST